MSAESSVELPAAGAWVPVQHGRITLALWCVRDATDPAAGKLLVLHGLGERTELVPPPAVDRWPGAVFGLDFTGHGASSLPSGGGYTCEVLVGDVDRTLSVLGPATIYGRGLGAYVGLIMAGAQPDLVRGVVLDDGPGLAGGGADPLTPGTGIPVELFSDPRRQTQTPDPYAMYELSRDVRPVDYAGLFARFALESSPIDIPITVSAQLRPPWLAAVAGEVGVADSPASTAVRRYATS